MPQKFELRSDISIWLLEFISYGAEFIIWSAGSKFSRSSEKRDASLSVVLVTREVLRYVATVPWSRASASKGASSRSRQPHQYCVYKTSLKASNIVQPTSTPYVSIVRSVLSQNNGHRDKNSETRSVWSLGGVEYPSIPPPSGFAVSPIEA
ncbi:hypothetical protein TNCV_4987411 [Trichonephila clavipes]|nr:hypothetical protein TNCV_4987411 [Trichonephila clavipes]